MPKEPVKPYVVRTPHNMIWSHRFYTAGAAWGRICGLKRMIDTTHARASLRKAGWRVTDNRLPRK